MKNRQAENIGLDTIKATKLHLGISDSEWNKMSLTERDEMRSQSYKNLKSGSTKISKKMNWGLVFTAFK